MSEIPARVDPNYLFLLGEPIFKSPEETKNRTTLKVPKGSEHWAMDVSNLNLTPEQELEQIGTEYLSLAQTLQRMGVPFRFIVAHEDLVDQKAVLGMNQILGMRGARLFPQIPPSITCFPRDILVNLDSKIIVNPEANLQPVNNSATLSMAGEGGAILYLGRKVFIPSIQGYNKLYREKLEKDIKKLGRDFDIQRLPAPIAVDVNTKTGSIRDSTNNHLDRVAAFIKGADGKDYLLVDPNYMDASWPTFGNYAPAITEACRGLRVELVVTEREARDVPYSLNLNQFDDGSVLISQGHPSLKTLLGQIVNQEKVFTTLRPLVLYPILRYGGIRCMTAKVPMCFFKSYRN